MSALQSPSHSWSNKAPWEVPPMPGLVGSQAEQIKTEDQLIISSPSVLVIDPNWSQFLLLRTGPSSRHGASAVYLFQPSLAPAFSPLGGEMGSPSHFQSHGGQISGAQLTLPKGRRPFPAILDAFLGKSDSAP